MYIRMEWFNFLKMEDSAAFTEPPLAHMAEVYSLEYFVSQNHTHLYVSIHLTMILQQIFYNYLIWNFSFW